ncbi:hypothetical protein JCM3766R1_002666 [Sporobolomyces carnicolor]
MTLHIEQMQRLLDMPLPRVGDKLAVPVEVPTSESETQFVAIVPGDYDLSVHNFPTWPLFKTLHVDNILSAAEIALAPSGRVLFVSKHPTMLSIATLTLGLILERNGWSGLVRSVTHARDLSIYVENPGPWVLAIPASKRTAILDEVAQAIAVVDLDSDSVIYTGPLLSALSTGSVRERALRKLDRALGNVGTIGSVSHSIIQAFPNGKFVPFSQVEIDGILCAHRTRVSLERQEAARLSAILEEEREYQTTLQDGFEAVERSRERALADLAATEGARRAIEEEYLSVCDAMRSIARVEDRSVIAHFNIVGSMKHPAEVAAARVPPERRATLDSVAEEALEDTPRSADNAVNPSIVATAVSSSPSHVSSCQPRGIFTEVFESAPCDGGEPRQSSAPNFKPKPLALTPPISPEHGGPPPVHPFVTPRTLHRRTVSRQQSVSRSHSRQASHESNSDYDDALSFSSSEGGGASRDRGASVQASETARLSGSVTASQNLLDSARNANDVDQTLMSPPVDVAMTSPPSRQQKTEHSRQDSFGIDAPPVELFTRTSGSLTRRARYARDWSPERVDLGAS